MNKRIFEYEKYFRTGLWHCHTNYTDGQATVDEMCAMAVANQFPLIAFTEHVRKNLSYSFDDFLSDISIARNKYPHLIILAGVEAKVLENGGIDCDEQVLSQSQIVLLAEHGFHGCYLDYVSALKEALSNSHVDCWAHPGSILPRKEWNISSEDLTELLKVTDKHQVAIEYNVRYGNLIPALYTHTPKNRLIFAYDLHHTRINKYLSRMEQIQKKFSG